MDENCPKCGNEIYKPYVYCNACGWEKSTEDKDEEFDEWEEEEFEEEEYDDEQEKGSKKKSKKDKKKSKKSKEDIKIKEKYEKPTPLKITCKCGGIINIKSSKRPLKFQCPDCGKKGTLKGTEKIKSDSKKTSTSKRKTAADFDEPQKKKRKDPYSYYTEDDRDHDGSRGFKQKRDLKAGKDREQKKHMKSKDICPDCGSRLSVTGTCPSCGYRPTSGSRTARKQPMEKELRQSKKKRPRFSPPESAHVVRPIKGKCTWCGSRNLRYFDDGSGRCTNCGKEFNFGGDSSRIQKKEYQCQHCRKPLEFIEEYQRWYCYNCNEYA